MELKNEPNAYAAEKTTTELKSCLQRSPFLVMELGRQTNNHSTGMESLLESFRGPLEHRGTDSERGNQDTLQGGGDLWV